MRRPGGNIACGVLLTLLLALLLALLVVVLDRLDAIGELPKTSTGKIQKTVLRDRANELAESS